MEKGNEKTANNLNSEPATHAGQPAETEPTGGQASKELD